MLRCAKRIGVLCATALELTVTVVASTHGATAADLGLTDCNYKAGDVEYAADCGTLAVAENRSDPASRLISLPLIRVRATGGEPAEPIFWLAGGPGGSNLNFERLAGLVKRHDIVMVGYRGMDGPVVLECPEMAAGIKGVGRDLLSQASVAAFGNAMRACAQRLQAEGVDLSGYSAPNVVRDVEIARSELGYERISLLSQSYGTRLAMMYAWMYPESVHRSAMISVNPPGHFVWEPEVVDSQIRYDAGLCAQDASCGARTDDLAKAMRRVLRDVPKRWFFIPINPGKVRFMTQFMLFHRGTAAAVFDAYLAADRGDYSGLALMSVMHDFVLPSSLTWGDFISKGADDYAEARDWFIEMMPPSSILGSPLSLLVGGAARANGGWPVTPVPPELRAVQPSATRTLLIGGNIDYSTPARFATEELLPALGNGEQVILSEFGHSDDVWEFQPEATRHLLTTFFATGEVDASRFTHQPMNFDVRFGFPLMAKLGLAGIVLIALLIGLLVLWVARLLLRRGARRRPT